MKFLLTCLSIHSSILIELTAFISSPIHSSFLIAFHHLIGFTLIILILILILIFFSIFFSILISILFFPLLLSPLDLIQSTTP